MALGDSAWADVCWETHSETSPIDLDRFRRDPADQQILKIRVWFGTSSNRYALIVVVSLCDASSYRGVRKLGKTAKTRWAASVLTFLGRFGSSSRVADVHLDRWAAVLREGRPSHEDPSWPRCSKHVEKSNLSEQHVFLKEKHVFQQTSRPSQIDRARKMLQNAVEISSVDLI